LAHDARITRQQNDQHNKRRSQHAVDYRGPEKHFYGIDAQVIEVEMPEGSSRPRR
jgi:hypothetical protein